MGILQGLARLLGLDFSGVPIGWFYGTLLIVAVLASLVTTALLLFRGRGPTLGPALLLVVPLPLLVGAVALVGGVIDTYYMIADSTAPPRSGIIAIYWCMALAPLRLALFATLPIGLAAVVGGLFRIYKGNRTDEQ